MMERAKGRRRVVERGRSDNCVHGYGRYWPLAYMVRSTRASRGSMHCRRESIGMDDTQIYLYIACDFRAHYSHFYCAIHLSRSCYTCRSPRNTCCRQTHMMIFASL